MSHYMTALAMKQTGLKPAAKIVLYWLADHHNSETDLCCPSHATLAKECEMSKRAVQGHLDDLEAKGLITRSIRVRDNGSQSSCSYTLNLLPPIAESATPPWQNLLPHNLGSNNLGNKQTLVAQKRDVSARLVRDEIWTLWPLTGRRRSSQKKALSAIASLLKDYSPQSIVDGVKAYLASDEAKKGEGKFVPGVDRWLRDEKFAEWAKSDSVGETDWRGEIALYRDHGKWRPEGPPPGKPGCRAPESLIADFGFEVIGILQGEE